MDHKEMLSGTLQSKCIEFLRFPLIVGVVMVHSNLSTIQLGGVTYHFHHSPWYFSVIYLFSEVIPRISVPLFFLISGFLFFQGGKELTPRFYKEKFKRRFHTLLVPYVCWNLLAYGIYAWKHSGMFSGYFPVDMSQETGSLLSAFWNFKAGDNYIYPAYLPFWFLRDLMVTMLFAPLIGWLSGKLKLAMVGLLGVVWFLRPDFQWEGMSTAAFFFFTLGGYLQLAGRSLVPDFRKLLLPSLLLYAALAASDLLSRGCWYHSYIHNLGILMGMLFVLSLVTSLLAHGRVHASRFLSGASFFVYAFHGFLIWDLMKLLFVFLRPYSQLYMICLYFAVPTVVIFISLAIYSLLKRYAPAFLGFITGGR